MVVRDVAESVVVQRVFTFIVFATVPNQHILTKENDIVGTPINFAGGVVDVAVVVVGVGRTAKMRGSQNVKTDSCIFQRRTMQTAGRHIAF